MGCSNSKYDVEIEQIKKELSQQAQEQNTLQIEFTYLMNELKSIQQTLKDIEIIV